MKTAAKKKIRWEGEAVFDSTKKYRYALTRRFICPECNDEKTLFVCDCSVWLDKIVFIMLNPSTATAKESDPTVRRCEGYATLWGYRRLVVLNIFALRSTDPDQLYKEEDPVGPDNNRWIQNCTKDAEMIVCGWGLHGNHLGRGRKVIEMLQHKRPHYLRLTKDGIPGHPLYLPGKLKPKLFYNN